MTRSRALLLALAALGLGAIIGVILDSVWLGLLLGVLVALGIFLAFESGRGRNQGVNDEDNGVEL